MRLAPRSGLLALLAALAVSMVTALPAQAQLCKVLNELGACTPAPLPPLQYGPDGVITLPGVPSTSGPVARPAPKVPTVRPDLARVLFDQVNQERARAGAQPLTSRGDLVELATSQTRKMLGTGGSLLHNLDLLTKPLLNTLGAVIAGENVGWSTNAEDLHARLMASPSHRSVLLEPRFNTAGFAVIQDTDGLYYLTQDYIQASGASPAAAPAKATPKPAAAAQDPAGSVAPAEQASPLAGDASPANSGVAADGENSPGQAKTTPGGQGDLVVDPAASTGSGMDAGIELAQGKVAGFIAEAGSEPGSTPITLVSLAVVALAAALAGQLWWFSRGRLAIKR